MAKIVGLTGGIGSGKSTVARFFEALGVPVYYADDEAKHILAQPGTVAELVKHFGEEVAPNAVPDRAKIAALVFNDEEKLATLNSIIHPHVAAHFDKWVKNNNHHKYIIKEAAILFESGSYKDCDYIIAVTAPEEMRINRVIERDGVTREQVLQRMANQWDEAEKTRRADFIITNINREDAKKEVFNINSQLIA